MHEVQIFINFILRANYRPAICESIYETGSVYLTRWVRETGVVYSLERKIDSLEGYSFTW